MPTGYSKLTGKNPFKGKKRAPFSEETKKKMSLAKKGKSNPKHAEKIRGKRATIETRQKMSLAQLGEKHHAWKGGVRLLNIQIRNCFLYRQWRSDIFQRDGYTCVLCGKKGGWIEADHFPKPFCYVLEDNKVFSYEDAMVCEELWNINNGRTLCESCHNKNKKWKR